MGIEPRFREPGNVEHRARFGREIERAAPADSIAVSMLTDGGGQPKKSSHGS
jgi:hypothetical protein